MAGVKKPRITNQGLYVLTELHECSIIGTALAPFTDGHSGKFSSKSSAPFPPLRPSLCNTGLLLKENFVLQIRVVWDNLNETAYLVVPQETKARRQGERIAEPSLGWCSIGCYIPKVCDCHCLWMDSEAY